MTIVLCGGGSGGHITPLLAVARELRNRSNEIKLVYVGEKRGKFSHIAEDSGLFDQCFYISAGKLRRYHGESLLRRVTDVKTIFLNLRDCIRLTAGTLQSILLFRKIRPDSVLLKGGYVCVPASIGAHFAKALIVTHDSDALPGLSNRFAARYAAFHAVAMPAQYYRYPKETIREVGLPVNDQYKHYSPAEVRFLKEKFDIPATSKVILVTGGSNGASRLNRWSIQAITKLLEKHSDVFAVVVAGIGKVPELALEKIDETIRKRIKAIEFTDELYHYFAISDVIITRAGATTITECAAASKACILVPNPDLTGGHQLKNAVVYADQKCALVVQEQDLKTSVKPLEEAIERLISDDNLRLVLTENLHKTLPKITPQAALADLLEGEGKGA